MEFIDYFDKNDDTIEQALQRGETEFTYNPNPVPWVRLFKFYNWDTPYNEVLYFYEREEELLHAISFGTTNDGGYIITQKEFKFNDRGDKINYQDDMYSDPWEIYEGELKLSDTKSLGDIIKGIFSKRFEILYQNALKKLK